MKYVLSVIAIIMMMLLIGWTGFAVDSEKDGCMKISIDSLPMFGGSEKEDGNKSEYVDDATSEEKYTYNAMGQKVPTRTERSGDASPIH